MAGAKTKAPDPNPPITIPDARPRLNDTYIDPVKTTEITYQETSQSKSEQGECRPTHFPEQ